MVLHASERSGSVLLGFLVPGGFGGRVEQVYRHPETHIPKWPMSY